MKITIKRIDGTVITTREGNSVKDVVEQLVKECVSLHWADLTGADLKKAYLKKADFTKANLTEAYLKRAYLTKADFTGAYFYLNDGKRL